MVSIDQGAVRANEIGARHTAQRTGHLDAIRRLNEHPAWARELRGTAMLFILSADEALRSDFQAALARFPEDLPFEFEEQRGNPEIIEELLDRARLFAEIGCADNYNGAVVDGGIQVTFDNPRANEPATRAKLDELRRLESHLALSAWAKARADGKEPTQSFGLDEAVRRAGELDEPGLFSRDRVTGSLEDTRLAGIAGVAAAVLDPGSGAAEADLRWAVDVTAQALRTPEPGNGLTIPDAIVWDHPCIHAGRALAHIVRRQLDTGDVRGALLRLIAHPLQAVGTAALAAALSLRDVEPRFAWTAFGLAVDLSIRDDPQGPSLQGNDEREQANARRIDEALNHAQRMMLEARPNFPALPRIPGAWTFAPLPPTGDEAWDARCAANPIWRDPDRYLDVDELGRMLGALDVDWALSDAERRSELMILCDALLHWTISKHTPQAEGHDLDAHGSDLWQWRSQFLGWLGFLASHMDPADLLTRFVAPLAEVQGEPGFTLLDPFASRYACSAILDAERIDPAGVEVLLACAARLGQRGEEWYDGRLGRDEASLVRTLLFAEVVDAQGATRFANGEFQEISVVLPLVDAMLERVGRLPTATQNWLSLVERAAAFYPTGDFVRQALALAERRSALAWRGSIIPALLSGLIHHLAERDAPLELDLATGMMRLLDILIDEGDRRSGALQASQVFRTVALD